MKITVRCGVFDGRKPCGRNLGTIKRKGFPENHDGLLWEERHYTCLKHGALQVHDEDLLRLALNPSPPVIMARSVLRMGQL